MFQNNTNIPLISKSIETIVAICVGKEIQVKKFQKLNSCSTH